MGKPNVKSSTRNGGGKENVIVNKSIYSRYCVLRAVKATCHKIKSGISWSVLTAV